MLIIGFKFEWINYEKTIYLFLRSFKDCFYQTIFAKRKVVGTQRLAKKSQNLCAVCQSCGLFAKAVCCLPKLCAVCQSCVLFAKAVCCLPKLCAVCKALFAIKNLSSSRAKKPRMYVGEIDLWWRIKKKLFSLFLSIVSFTFFDMTFDNRCQFHQRSMSSFYMWRSNDSQVASLFCAFGICALKSCS